MTRIRWIVALLALVALWAAGPASAQKPPKPPGQSALTLKAATNPVVFPAPLMLSGSVKGAKQGVIVLLQRRTAATTVFTDVASTATDAKGDYAFTTQPSANGIYRTTAAATPPALSPELTVGVRPLVSFKVGDSTPKRGQRVRFRGSVRPAHDGRRVSIQRKRADGTFATVKRTRLRAADGDLSRYRTRLRVRRTGTYRVRIAGHADHLAGFSRERTLTVG